MTRRIVLRDEQGNALIVVMVSAFVLTMLVFTALSRSDSQNVESARLARASTAFQASEAGVDDYIAKLTEDRNYHLHWVHQAEATRTKTNGTKIPTAQQRLDDPNGPWEWIGGDTTWTYADGKDGWRTLGNGVEYDLKITPPTATSGNQVKITSTGRRTAQPDEWRANEAVVRPSSIADFQRIVGNGSVSWGATATTFGKLYASNDITHDGTAHGDLYAIDDILAHPTYQSGAQGYDSNSNPTASQILGGPINFSSFLGSFGEVETAAIAAGLALPNDSTAAGWRLKFMADGNVAYARCTLSGSQNLGTTQPTCGADTIRPVPANGAIFSHQNVIVSWPSEPSTLDGRITVVSKLNIFPAGNIAYETAGDDVLGLIAGEEMIIPSYVPNVMNWTSANLAQGTSCGSPPPANCGDWHTAGPNGSKSTMNHAGSTATLTGGSLTMFNTRNYSYDLNLLNLPPPYYPVLEDAYTVTLFREVDVNS